MGMTMAAVRSTPPGCAAPALVPGLALVAQGKFARVEAAPPHLAADDVLIQVAGCGVCHTDIGFAYDGVPTRHGLPLILGHEISGRVVLAGEQAGEWLGRSVIVPAVIPCGACDACGCGHATICRKQFMPGNDGDGGFATHVRVPARGLCPVPDQLPAGITLETSRIRFEQMTSS